jgi:hypothetical protein
MMMIRAEGFHLSEVAFQALRRLRDKPEDPKGYESSVHQLRRKGFAAEFKAEDGQGHEITFLGEQYLGLGLVGREQLAEVTAPALDLLVRIVSHRGTLPASNADNRVMRGIDAGSRRRWVRRRLGEEGMVVEATAQGLAVARLVSTPSAFSDDPEDAERLIAVRSCQPDTALFPALARGAELDVEDLLELYRLRDLGLAELLAPSMAPPPQRDLKRLRGAPVWRFTIVGGHRARKLGFEVPERLPTTADPVQPLPLGSGHTLRALVQGHDLVAHDEHRLHDLEALRLAERLVPDNPEEPCLWRPTTAGVVLATVELHARASAQAIELGMPDPGHEATVSATFGPSSPTQESTAQ